MGYNRLAQLYLKFRLDKKIHENNRLQYFGAFLKSCKVDDESAKQFPRFISIGDVLKAGKLQQPVEEKKSDLELEYFDKPLRIWVKESKTLAIKS